MSLVWLLEKIDVALLQWTDANSLAIITQCPNLARFSWKLMSKRPFNVLFFC